MLEASADLGATPRRPSARDPAAGAAGGDRGVDLHLLADAGRLHHPADHRHVARFIGQAVYQLAGHGREHPAGGGLCRGADRHHGLVYLWMAKRRGGLRCALSPPPLGLKIAALGGLLFLHLPILLIFLYAFTTEERTYQFPPPGLTLQWFGVPGTGPTSGRRCTCRCGWRRSRPPRADPGHAGAPPRWRGRVLRARADLAADPPAHRAARHHHRHVAALGLRVMDIPFSTWTIVLGHATFCIVIVYNNAVARFRRLSGGSSRRRWTLAPTASRPSAT
jgi:hypothetical protein